MKRARRLILACFAAQALAIHAQSAINSGAIEAGQGLPLRNLQIEVQQLEQTSEARDRIDAAVTARVQPGHSDLAIGIAAQAQQSGRSGSSQQQVLVLNGRRATLRLGNAVSLRLLQSVWHNGAWHLVPGAVWLEAGTGFDAIPRWDGGDLVELELATFRGRAPLAGNSTSASTSLRLPLGEWITVAESDEAQDNQGSNLTGTASGSRQTSLRVQVRVSLR